MNSKMDYHLVIEYLPGDFMPIDINVLTNDYEKKYNNLDTIDAFTKKYTINELFDMIEEANLVPSKYLDGGLEIINNRKYRYPIISKDTSFSLDLFLSQNISNGRMMNKFLNIFLKYDKNHKDEMQKAIDSGNIYEVLNLIFELPYEKVRNIYTYMLQNSN